MEYAKYQLEELHKEVIKRQKDKVKGYGTLEDIAKLKYCNLKILLNLIEKLQKEIDEMKKDLSNIIDLMHFNVITKEGEIYRPIKNLSKQDVYEIYYKIQEILETNRIYRKY